MLERLFAGALCLFAPAAQAAAPKPGDPARAIEKAVAAANEAVRKGDWEAYAALLDPDSLKDFRALLEPVLKAAKKKGEAGDLLSFFDGAKDIGAVLAWQPEVFFARFMKALTSDEALKAVYSSTKMTFLGVVREGDDRAYAVVRTSRKHGKAEVKRVEVMSLRKTRGRWRLVAEVEPRGLAESIRRGTAPGNVGKDSRNDEADPER